MMQLSFSRTSNADIAVIDIAAGRISAAIARVPTSGPAHVLAEASTVCSSEAQSAEQAVATLPSLLDDVLKRLLATYSARPHAVPIRHAYALVHEPWVRTNAFSASADFGTATLIDEAKIKSCAREALTQSGTQDTSRLLEAAVVSVRLNGYPVAHPEGKRASTLAIDALMSECETRVAAAIPTACAHYMPAATVTRMSATRSVLSALYDGAAEPPSCLIIDVGAESTSFTAVRGGALAASRTVNEGVRTMLARIAKNRPAEETLGLIRMLATDACDGAACDAVRAAMAAAEPDLVKAYGDALGAMASVDRIPNALYLCVHKDAANWLGQFFSRIDFAQFTVTTLPFVPRTEEFIHERVDNASRVDSSLAMGVIAAALAERS